MSRIAKHPIQIPQGVDVKVNNGELSVKGKKGELKLKLVDDVSVEIKDGALTVKMANDSRFAKNMWGTTAANFRNMLQGVTEGFTKKLIIEGVGYKAAAKGNGIVLSLGFSHDIDYPAPAGIEIKVIKPTELDISGIDKQKVGLVADEIVSFRPPEPYKGKGVRYDGQRILRKEGKKK